MFAGGSSRTLHTTPVNQANAVLDEPHGNRSQVLSPTEHSIADVFEGEGMVIKFSDNPELKDFF